MKIFTAAQYCEKAKAVATNYKTLYIKGCFGAPMNAKNKQRYSHNYAYNEQPARTKKIMAASADTFGFDCVGFATKALFWGWNGNKNATYGGAVYKANGVPDVGADRVMQYCTDVSTNFKNIVKGELLHKSGHVGIYLGDGLAAECSPAWKDGVQITAVANIGAKAGYHSRTWTNHGKLIWIDYTEPKPEPTPTPAPSAVYYTVVKGDNLTKIARKYGTTVAKLLQLNPDIKNKNIIHVGQKIRVK